MLINPNTGWVIERHTVHRTTDIWVKLGQVGPGYVRLGFSDDDAKKKLYGGRYERCRLFAVLYLAVTLYDMPQKKLVEAQTLPWP